MRVVTRIYGLFIYMLILDYSSADESCSGMEGCVTETSYKFPGSDVIMHCPEGLVCTNNNILGGICQENVKPSCEFSYQCANCDGGVSSVCISKTQYASCADGMLGELQSCTTPGPYCTMRIGKDDIVERTCTNELEQARCEAHFITTTTTSTTTTTTTTAKPTTTTTTESTTIEPTTSTGQPDPGVSDDCTTLGKFPVKSDTTCQSYVYCYPEKDMKTGIERIGKTLFKCPTNLRFDPSRQKCVHGRYFTCSNS